MLNNLSFSSLSAQTGKSSEINDVKNCHHSDMGQYDSVCNSHIRMFDSARSYHDVCYSKRVMIFNLNNFYQVPRYGIRSWAHVSLRCKSCRSNGSPDQEIHETGYSNPVFPI